MDNKNPKHWQTLVLFLKYIAKEKNITQQEIADSLKVHRQHIMRFFSLRVEPKLGLFIGVANAIGVNFFFESKDSDTDLNKAFEKAMEELGRRPDKLPKN